MGGGSSKEGFQNGVPEFQYDEAHKCTTEGNGLLFRLVNNETGQWAFYNDTKDLEFNVRVVFHNSAEIAPLGNTLYHVTQKWEVDETDGGSMNNPSVDADSHRNSTANPGEEEGEQAASYTATLIVYAGQTEPFIEGTVNGFKANYSKAKLSKEGKAYIKQKEEEKKRMREAEAQAAEKGSMEGEDHEAAENAGEEENNANDNNNEQQQQEEREEQKEGEQKGGERVRTESLTEVQKL